MEFRTAAADDVEPIRAIARASWEVDYPDIVSRETIAEGFEDWYAPEELTRELEEADATVLLAVEDGEPVGFAHGVVTGGVGHLLRLYVRPEARGRGVGRRLLERTADRLADEGAERLRAMVLAGNDVGQSFYRSAGFEPAGSAETHIGPETREELTFERPIRAPAEST